MAYLMKLVYVSAEQMTPAQFGVLTAGGVPGGYSAHDIALRLAARVWTAFEFDGGMLAVEKIGSRLYVRALSAEGFGWRLRAFRDVMDRLATDLMCDTVETTCFNERLARAMVRIKARAESWTMVWQVEGRSSGQQKDDGN